MTMSKYDFEEYYGHDSRVSHNMMNMLRAKLPTKTMVRESPCKFKINNGVTRVQYTTVNSIDVLHLCERMLGNTKHPKVKTKVWEDIKELAQHIVNRNLANAQS